jgi:hypothetical protein
MVELFRYIEHSFVVPTTTDSIDVNGESAFQNRLRDAIQKNQPPDAIRKLGDSFLLKTFSSPVADPFKLGSQFLALRDQVTALPSPGSDAVKKLISTIFGSDAGPLIHSSAFLADKQLLNDSLVAVKLVTGFDRTNVANLVSTRQAMAFLEEFGSGKLTNVTAASIQQKLSRPINIPQEFVKALIPTIQTARTGSEPPSTQGAPSPDISALNTEHAALKSAYDAIMALQPSQFELATSAGVQPRKGTHKVQSGGVSSGGTLSLDASPMFLRIPRGTLDGLDKDQRKALDNLGIDISALPASSALDTIKKKWLDAAKQVLPSQVPVAAKVYRLGLHLFSIRDLPAATTTSISPTPPLDFSRVITRPVGVGDLQVVKQELLSYVAGDISHIENVLEGELMRRSTRREEVNELTITQETDTTQTVERDQQSTDRNELATETQKETGQQSSSSQGQTTTSDYGKLVENSKTNYARSTTDKAVNSLTQMVKQQRIQRERKTYTEKALHEFDNRQGTKKIRGIYQWVDKNYKARIINYGKRLLYDVVVPEPAAFLIDSLKNAIQPETFQLTKPADPGIGPLDLNVSNYTYYASLYGVTGSVTPAPDEFIQTITKADAPQDVSKTISAFGGTWFSDYVAGFSIKVPDNYKVISGYIQKTNPNFGDAPNTPHDRQFEFYIGENYSIRFDPSHIDFLNHSFLMNGETGDIPVTMRTLERMIQFNYAIGFNCQRTDKAFEQWQLKTHAAIMAGYQRQLADYQDKLKQYQSAVRTQMAMVQNFAHDPTIETQELKKAFIYLLLGEHFGQAYIPTPDPEAIPPDPVYVKAWGAMVAFFERAFEWENIMYTYYPYFWGRQARWGELILVQDTDPEFEAFLKAGAARVVIPVRPGFEGALAHYQETGDVWMGEEMPDMFSDFYVSIIEEIKARNYAPGSEICVAEWDVKVPTTLVMLKGDEVLPEWKPTVDCSKAGNP